MEKNKDKKTVKKNTVKKTIYTAFLEFTKNKPVLEFDEVVDYTTKKGEKVFYKYASLNEIESKATPVLASLDLFYRFDIQDTKVQAILVFTDGSEIQGGYIEYSNLGDGIQQKGGNLTMAKRYTLATLLGLSASEDKEKIEVELEKAQGTIFNVMLKGIKNKKPENLNDLQDLEKQREILEIDNEKVANGDTDKITYVVSQEQRAILLEKINEKITKAINNKN